MKRRPRGNSINIESKLSFNTLYKTANDNSTGENKDFNDSLNDRISNSLNLIYFQKLVIYF